MTFLFGWIVFSVLVGVIAAKRGRSGFGFFFLSLLLSPLLGLIAAIAMPNLEQEDAEARAKENDRQFQRDLAAAVAPQPAASFADEIEKLVSLQDRGVITHAEFVDQKAKLLSSPLRSPVRIASPSLGSQAECAQVLEARGYSVKRRSNGAFEVYEPLGGRASIPDLERLISYTNERRSLPVR